MSIHRGHKRAASQLNPLPIFRTRNESMIKDNKSVSLSLHSDRKKYSYMEIIEKHSKEVPDPTKYSKVNDWGVKRGPRAIIGNEKRNFLLSKF